MFLDKFRFCPWVHDDRRKVKRWRGEKWFLEFARKRVKNGRIILRLLTHLVFSKRHLKDKRSIDEVLEPFAILYIQGKSNVTFQSNNACSHITDNINTLPCFGRLHDLSPIRHVLNMMDRRVKMLPNPQINLKTDTWCLQVAWNDLP